ncbi:hypothetical protein QR680_004086 [Steinernema hermaphroditum]|uniref:Uncharacterized protein n=1 Tax=Steinernema hermaphroditum TaxID=289476 RepID=A0AA39HML7_9BILA|nr:hypothetical protein QR680_004086 [Steinernema hermaphroditum]
MLCASAKRFRCLRITTVATIVGMVHAVFGALVAIAIIIESFNAPRHFGLISIYWIAQMLVGLSAIIGAQRKVPHALLPGLVLKGFEVFIIGFTMGIALIVAIVTKLMSISSAKDSFEGRTDQDVVAGNVFKIIPHICVLVLIVFFFLLIVPAISFHVFRKCRSYLIHLKNVESRGDFELGVNKM